ncbi:hypothetical protein TWF718_005176 [Orbilia javanica]|uniref:Uncharacterized protein n=1 Tax=Orbilia javanica TaxID=47235 RepID=A0AAN8N3T7_9PEZI
MMNFLLFRPVILLLFFTSNYPRVLASPAIAPPVPAQGVPHSLQFGNPITISASISLGVPQTKTKGLPPSPPPPSLPPPAPPLLPSTISIAPSILTSPISLSPSTTLTPTHVQTPPSSSFNDDKDIPTTSILSITPADPQITEIDPAKSTWVQDDYPPQSSTSTPIPSIPTSLERSYNITCRNFPSRSSLTICSPTLLVILFLIFYTGILRIVMYLQESSARQVLELGEALMGHRDSNGGYAWTADGSWKIRQQPELPAVAMMGVDDLERIVGEEGGGKGYGTMKVGGMGDEGLARGERIWLRDLDYRRKKVRKGNNTPEGPSTIGSGKGKRRVSRTEEWEGNDHEGSDGEMGKGLTAEQRKEVERKRREMVKKAHERMLDDTKSQRVFYGAIVVAGSVGLVFVILGTLLGVLCKQLRKIGGCPFEG